jgi:molecular chaperone HtpG
MKTFLLKPVIEEVVEKSKFSVQFVSMSETDQPMTIVQPEFMRRMKEMQAVGGGGGMQMFGGAMPDTYNLVVNTNHPLISKILNEKDKVKQNQITKRTTDLALLSQNMLKGEELTKFINQSIELI